MRRVRVAAGVGAAVVALGLAAFLWRPAPRRSAQETLLTLENQELLKLSAAAESGRLLDFDGLLVVVDQRLVQDLLRAVTPLEADVGGGFHVRIATADTAFGDGVALVRLAGYASVRGGIESARITVFGSIDVVELDQASGTLRCRVNILGVEADNPESLGRGDTLGRLSEVLARGGLALLLGPLEIPVSVETSLRIPAVETKRLRIAAQQLPLTVAVQKVRVFSGRLWVFVGTALQPAAQDKG